jgi:hypothetical protein
VVLAAMHNSCGTEVRIGSKSESLGLSKTSPKCLNKRKTLSHSDTSHVCHNQSLPQCGIFLLFDHLVGAGE